MKMISIMCTILVLYGQSASQGHVVPPPDPAEQAKHTRVRQLIDQAQSLVQSGDESRAIQLLNDAAAVEATIIVGTGGGHFSNAIYALARLYVKQSRVAEALDAYKRVFAWNAAQGDIEIGSGAGVHAAMEYAILLAKSGRSEDAKAMYYYGLRAYMSGKMSRAMEPAPLLTVFDADPEGIQWDYTPQRLEAAGLMLQAMLSSGRTDFATNVETSRDQFVARARELAPDWFYPVLFKAAQAKDGSPEQEQLLSQAEALARNTAERQIVDWYRNDVAEHLALNIANDTPGASDMRPMTFGAERRARIQCLRPNEQVLRRISIKRPGG
jgi:tetratricopeptide (TPR) repeat protein